MTMLLLLARTVSVDSGTLGPHAFGTASSFQIMSSVMSAIVDLNIIPGVSGNPILYASEKTIPNGRS
jgi:hypothetical protein